MSVDWKLGCCVWHPARTDATASAKMRRNENTGI
jgi:hypothetical protein